MVKAKSVPTKKSLSASPVSVSKSAKLAPVKKVGKKEEKRAFASNSMRKMIKELVKECGRGGQTVGKQACEILHVVLENHCTAILKGAEVRALQQKRQTVTSNDVKKEAYSVHAQMWPERFKK